MDFRLFEITPGISILLRPDPPVYRIVTASDDFLTKHDLRREEIIGKEVTDLFGIRAEGKDRIKLSLELALKERRPNEVIVENAVTGENGQVKHRSVPVLDDTGNVSYILHSTLEFSATSVDKEKIPEAHGLEEAYRFFMQAPVIIGYVYGDNYVINLANDALLKVWRKNRDVVGKRLFDVFPELEQQGIRELLDQVRKTGKPFFAYEYPMTFQSGGRDQTLYFDFVYHPYYEHEGDAIAAGIISIGHNVTEKVGAKQQFKNVIEQATTPIMILRGEEMTLEAANDALLKLWSVNQSVIGKPLLQVRPSIKEQGFHDLLLGVYRTGQPYRGFGAPLDVPDESGSQRRAYYNYHYQPYREADGKVVGVIVVAYDATEQILAERHAHQSEEKWRQLANTMPTIVWIGDPKGNVNFFNQRWYEFTGLTDEASLGFSWTQVLHPEDVDRCLTLWREAIRSQTLYEVESRFRTRHGTYRWVITRGIPIKTDGEVTAWYGTSTDIHELKELEYQLEEKVRNRTEELAEKNLLLDNILKNSSNGITVSEMIFDDEGNVVDAMTIVANEAAVKFAGIPREIYLTRRATELDPNIMRSPYGQGCLKTLQTGEPMVMQYFLDFSGRWLELTVSRMDDRHLIHIFTDVTDIKKAQLDLERSLDNLKYANANLEEFAYAASHDLKEPVRKIHFFANRLRENLQLHLRDDDLRLFDRLEKSAGRMEKLIDDLLEYSQAAKGSSRIESVHLDEIINGVLEDLELEIQNKRADVTVSKMPVIMGNPRQMQQLFQNLISNALKYNKKGVPPRIELTAGIVSGGDILSDLSGDQGEKQFHLIRVSDNGIGFDQKDEDKIFNLFTRLHSDVEYRGSGVGLSIVKRVVDSHGGFIRVRSEAGKGSTFMILLPMVSGE